MEKEKGEKMNKIILLTIGLIIVIMFSGCIENDVSLQDTETKQEEVIEVVTHVHAKHILVSSLQEAQKVLEELKGGATFEKLAEMESKCPSGKNGGDLGWFARGQMVKEFEKAAFELEKGAISEPVKTEFGWHIIKVVDKR